MQLLRIVRRSGEASLLEGIVALPMNAWRNAGVYNVTARTRVTRLATGNQASYRKSEY